MSSWPKNLSVTFAVILAVVVVVLAAGWSRSSARVMTLVQEREAAADRARISPPRPETVIVALPAPAPVPAEAEPTEVAAQEPAPTPVPPFAVAPVPDAQTFALAQPEAAPQQPTVTPAPTGVPNAMLSAGRPSADPLTLNERDAAVQGLVVLERRLSSGDVSTAAATLDTAEPALNGFAQMRVRNARLAIDNKDLTTARSELLAAIGEASRSTP